jgi:hypothetical protein
MGASDVFDPAIETGEEGRVAEVVGLMVVLETGTGELVWASDIENAPSNVAVTKPNRFRGVAILVSRKECGSG